MPSKTIEKPQELTGGHAATYAPADPVERAEVAEMESDALFAQLQALVAPEPGMHVGQAINKNAAKDIGLNDPTGQLSVPMVAAHVESAGYTLLYDQANGETSVVNNNMLQQALKKLHPETGKVMFGLRPPRDKKGAVVIPFKGTQKCRLHPDDPDRALWNEMGFKTCGTDNLRTPFVVTRHMETRHKQEWKAILSLVAKGANAPSAA